MELDDSVRDGIDDLPWNAFDVPYRSDAITNEIHSDIYDHVQELRDMGLDWEPRWSERGEYDYLKEAWGSSCGD